MSVSETNNFEYHSNLLEIYNSKRAEQMRCAKIGAIVLVVCLIAAAFFAVSIFFPVIAIPIGLKIACTALSLTVTLIAVIVLFKNRQRTTSFEERSMLQHSIRYDNGENSMDP